jgi:hypothetical protein
MVSRNEYKEVMMDTITCVYLILSHLALLPKKVCTGDFVKCLASLVQNQTQIIKWARLERMKLFAIATRSNADYSLIDPCVHAVC